MTNSTNNPQDQYKDISEIDIIFIQDAEATSDITEPPTPGISGPNITLPELHDLCTGVQTSNQKGTIIKQVTPDVTNLGLEGHPRIVLVGHGGQFNFLTKEFYCDVRRSSVDLTRWEWKDPTGMQHLGVSAWRFKEVEEGW